jgi:hypothetical protein
VHGGHTARDQTNGDGCGADDSIQGIGTDGGGEDAEAIVKEIVAVRRRGFPSTENLDASAMDDMHQTRPSASKAAPTRRKSRRAKAEPPTKLPALAAVTTRN